MANKAPCMKTPIRSFIAIFIFAVSAHTFAADGTVTRVPVVFSEGHDTDPRDHGRPVALVAGALGVTSEVFRDAFSRVHPAGPDRGPSPEEARANKAAVSHSRSG